MLCKVFCAACKGLDAFVVTVEVDVSDGISFFLVGLPDNAVKESQQRIGSALGRYGYRIPGKRIVINLAPANMRKEGSAFDVPIAMGILLASGQAESAAPQDFIILGELALDGSLRPVTGALPVAIHAAEQGYKYCIFPVASAMEACELDGITVFGAETLQEVIGIMRHPDKYSHQVVNRGEVCRTGTSGTGSAGVYDFADVKGQVLTRRGLEIAAAGGHNVLMTGSPGSGKTLMAKCLPSILPLMSRAEALETSKIYSVAGLLPAGGGLLKERPFRHPHHTSTVQSLAGSGMNGLPGEISLAHNGVLFLDELAEFGRSSVELLRQPLEDGVIQLCRARSRYCYPASFMLVAAMNPCPCGYLYDPVHACSCSSSAVMRYTAKISGPLLDRIDIQLTVDAVAAEELVGENEGGTGEPSRVIAQRVAKAREVQMRRYAGENFYTNARIPPGLLGKYCKMGEAERLYLRKMVGQLNISARGYARILKISRTIADLDGEDFISLGHISSAVQFKLNIKGNL